ncbi:MAG TPA: rod shape-determining protein MreD [Nocardioidaceae bacterium]|jgi:rod shape-determining protein MreD|nr:rod shape-determining protein MreD [Nocardioidaceae bacterium]
MVTLLRSLVVAVLVVLAVALQVGPFTVFSFAGVVPDLALLVVLATALVRGPEYAALVGFAAGLLLDVAPPADHTAGRWALAFVVVGYLAGLVRYDARSSALAAVVVVAAGSFIATSLFALSGLVLGDPGVSVDGVLRVLPIAVVYDVVLTPFVLPVCVVLLGRLQPAPEWR